MYNMNEYSVTIKVDNDLLGKITKTYQKYSVVASGDYVVFKAEYLGTLITAYSSNKPNVFKIVFIGSDALLEARKWNKDATYNKKKEQVKENWLDLNDQIGSDEVGVGDLFLPMIVVASYVNNDDVQELIKLGIHDSKKLTDSSIRKIGPYLIKRFQFSKLTLSNEKYNEMILKGENLNTLKAKMHNKALDNMLKKYPEAKKVYIDQFVDKGIYYHYLKDEKVVVDRIIFKTKGESFFPSVALASVIARYAFLKEKDQLEKKYKVVFPFGAGKKADDFALRFIKKFGKAELDKLAKTNFKNYQALDSNKLI